MWLDFKQTEIQGMLNQGTQGKKYLSKLSTTFPTPDQIDRSFQ